MSNTRRILATSVLMLCTGGSLAQDRIKVARAVVPLTHEAVARAYNPKFGGYPVVGDPAAPEAERWADIFFRYHFTARNGGSKAATVQATATKPDGFAIATEFRIEPEKLEIAPGTTASVTLVVKVPGEAAAKLPAGYQRDIEVRFVGEGVEGGTQKVVFWVPAVAKILAGADGTGIPADVLPPDADYAHEFAGGWDGARFKQPFLAMSGHEVEARRKMVAEGFKPLHNVDYPFPRADLGRQPEYLSIKMLPDQPAPTGNELGGGMLDLALRWAYTGDRKSAEKIRELAMAMVDRADRLGRGQRGRLCINGLSEAWVTTPVFFAFDLISGAGVFTPDEEKRFEDWMLYETTLMRQIFAYSNQQCEENIANFAAGLVAGDFRHFRFTYYPPYGLEGQLSGAFYADGFHREHQIGYHYRSINPMCEQAEALLRLGFCTYDERTHAALMQPVRATIFPGDDLGGNDFAACGIAWLRYRDPDAAGWLRITRKRGRLPLHYGGITLPEGTDASWKNGSHQPGSGTTILRASDGRRGIAFGWGRPEKRGAKDFMDYRLLYSDGRRACTFGAGQFGHGATPAHNCVVANERVEATPGVPVEMALDGEFPYCVAENPGPKPMADVDLAQPWPYPWIWPKAGDVHSINWPLGLPYPHTGQGKWWREWRPMTDVVRWSRAVALIEGGFLIADAVELEARGRIDRSIHLGGSLTPRARIEAVSVPLTPANAPLGAADFYRAAQSGPLSDGLANGRPAASAFPRGKTDETWSFTARMGGVGVTATVLGTPGTEVIRVESLQGSWGMANPFVIARREGVKQTRFIVFIEPSGGWDAKTPPPAPRLKGMARVAVTEVAGQALPDGQAAAVALDFGDRRVIVLLNDSGQEAAAGAVSTGKRFTAAGAR